MLTATDLRSPAYDQFEARTLELHAVIRGGRLNSPAADDLRDALADEWSALTPDQRRFGNAFSGDLYMLDPTVGEAFDVATDDERSPQRLGLGIKAAWDRRDWAAALVLLRRGPTFLTPAVIAYLRARAYGELGRPAAALSFIRHARQIDPDSTTYRMLELDWLAAGGERDEAITLAWSYVEDGAERAAVVLLASGLLITGTRDLDDAAAQPTVGRVARALRRVIAHLSRTAGDPEAASLLVTARLQLGACLEPTDPEAAQMEYQAVIDSTMVGLDGAIMRAQVQDYVRRRFGPQSPAMASDRSLAGADLTRILSTFKPEPVAAA